VVLATTSWHSHFPRQGVAYRLRTSEQELRYSLSAMWRVPAGEVCAVPGPFFMSKRLLLDESGHLQI